MIVVVDEFKRKPLSSDNNNERLIGVDDLGPAKSPTNEMETILLAAATLPLCIS